MRAKIAVATIGVLLVCFGITVRAAQAQGPCSLQTFAGTYVSYDKGSSLTIDLSSVGVLGPAPGAPPSPPAWIARGIVPFVNVAEVTYTPDGVGDGYFWIFAGSLSATLDPIPVHVTITEMNEDCTGKFQYTLANGATIEERLIIFSSVSQRSHYPSTPRHPDVGVDWYRPPHQQG